MTSLSNIWPIDRFSQPDCAAHLAHLTSTGPAPEAFPTWFVSHICMNRFAAYYLAKLLESIPASETRLRNEGITGMFNVVRGIHIAFTGIAHSRGLTIPEFADIPAETENEAKTDYEAMLVVVKAHATDELIQYVEHSAGKLHGGKCHWASLVAPVSVSTDRFLESTMTDVVPVATEGADWKPATEDHMVAPAKVMREELLRIRGEVPGWREDEARDFTAAHLKLMGDILGSVY